MKHLLNKEIYLTPTGNNARGSKAGEIIKATVVTVGRVFVTIIREGRGWEEKLRFRDDRNTLAGECNSGYLYYENKQEVIDTEICYGLATRIADNFQYERDYQKLGVDKLRAIVEILFGDDAE